MSLSPEQQEQIKETVKSIYEKYKISENDRLEVLDLARTVDKLVVAGLGAKLEEKGYTVLYTSRMLLAAMALTSEVLIQGANSEGVEI